MMEGVTSAGGTGSNAAIDGFLVAGKTGTAQKADPVTHGYSATRRIASFIGFVPADKPKLTILVVVDEPKTSPYGGVVAAPAFRAIAMNALAYLKITPRGETNKATRTIEAQSPPPPKTVAVSEGDDAPDAYCRVRRHAGFQGHEHAPGHAGDGEARHQYQVDGKRAGRGTESAPRPDDPGSRRGLDQICAFRMIVSTCTHRQVVSFFGESHETCPLPCPDAGR